MPSKGGGSSQALFADRHAKDFIEARHRVRDTCLTLDVLQALELLLDESADAGHRRLKPHFRSGTLSFEQAVDVCEKGVFSSHQVQQFREFDWCWLAIAARRVTGTTGGLIW